MTTFSEGYREYQLDNGLIVALQHTPTQTVAAKLRVNYGSSHEREGEEGLAHYLEHCLVSGGSEKYDPAQADEMRGSFGNTNAFTSTGRTTFVGQMLAEDLEPWMDYTSEHVFRPRFDKERMDGERERVLREISDDKSQPTYLADQEFKNLFYRGHPKGRSSLGSEAVVRNATQEVMRRFHGKGYHPNNMDLIVVGGLPGNIEEIVQHCFGQAPRGENMRRAFPLLEPLPEKIVVRRPAPERRNVDNPQESSAQIYLYYTGPVDGDEDESAVMTMHQLLGGDTNSLLFQNIGLKRGLAYQIGTSTNCAYNSGDLGITALVPANRIEESVEAIFGEINRMKTQRPSDKAVERIKRSVKYRLASSLESNDGHISAIELKLDEGLTPEKHMEDYDKVTPESVMEAANRYLPDRERGKYLLYIRDPLQT